MATEILFKFIGGPQGDETLTFYRPQYPERIFLEINWIKPSENGGAEIIKGQRPKNVEWLAATHAIYQKASPIKNSEVIYQFIGVKELRRCEGWLENKERQCRHEAVDDGQFCKTHRRKDLLRLSSGTR